MSEDIIAEMARMFVVTIEASSPIDSKTKL